MRTLAMVVTAATVLAPAIGWSQSGVDLSGTWSLDTHLSDNPQQVSAGMRIDLGIGVAAGASSELPSLFGPDEPPEGGGRAGRGGQNAPGRGGPPPRRRSEDFTPEDQNRLDELTATVRYPPPTLTIAQTPAAVTFTDAQGRARTFATNGKREKQTFEAGVVETTTTWEGPLLVSEYDLGKGRKMTYRYSIVPTTKQLLIRIAFESRPGVPGPFEIKQVYNRTTGPS